jgi:hypothetical protein
MLMPVKPETLKTIQEIERLEFLRDTVIPFVKEREKEGKVDFDQTFHYCGTPSCLLGWCTAFKELGLTRAGIQNDLEHKVFGIEPREWRLLFGMKRSGTLDDRSKAIDTIIQRKLGEM